MNVANNDLIMLKVENVSKIYKLGEIGGTTLRDELQRLKAKVFHKEDPTSKIGQAKIKKGEKFTALNNISFDVYKGERIGIIGQNGAGKSTLLKLISRVTGPSKGKIYLNGRVASMLEVGTGFHPELTGRENIYMNGAILGMTKKEINSKLNDIIEFSEVKQFIDTPVKRYSSGMYVKLAFSVAAHLDSEIMIMDEVLAVGDVAFQNKCLNKMKEVSENNNRTILYVSHNMNTIRQLCTKVLVLNKGCITFFGDVEKGIMTYLQVNDDISNKTYFDISSYKRPSHSTNGIHLLNLSFLCKNNSQFYRGEPIKLLINYECFGVYKNVRIRMIIRNTSDIPLGTSISSQFTIDEVSIQTKEIELNTNLLVEGRYFVSVAFFDTDNAGNEVLLDHVSRAFVFDIIENYKESDALKNWESFWWGNIHYPPIKIKK